MEVDWMELKEILDYAMRNGKLSELLFFHLKYKICIYIIPFFLDYSLKMLNLLYYLMNLSSLHDKYAVYRCMVN